MSDERNLYNYCDFWDDCDDHFDASGGIDAIKQRDEVDQLHQLLMSGQSFTKIDPAVISGSNAPIATDVLTPSPPVSDDSCQNSTPEPPQPTTENQLVSPSLPAPDSTAATTTTTPTPTKPTSSSSSNKSLKHKCDTCSQVFDSKIALSIHTGRIHKHEGRDKNYQCSMCPKAFFNSSYLAQHMRIHTGNKPYPCPDCDKRFTQLSHLQQHKRTHTGEKPYKCQQPGCSKAFSQLSNLQSHTRSHLPDGNVHKCTSCYKCYYDEASLNAHMRTHMENKRVRNYRCEECGKSYTQDTYLQNHINNKHAGGSSVMEPLNSFPATRRPAGQPTSIQAATSMICKMEEPPATQCGFSGIMGQQVPPPSTLNFTQEPAPTGPVANSFPGIPHFTDSAAPAAVTARNSYHDTSSAFKPVMRPAFNTSVEPLSQCGSTVSRPQVLRPYEQPCSGGSNIIIPEPVTPNVDIKPNREEIAAADTDFYWRMKSNMAVSSAGLSDGGSGLTNYSHLPAQIQNYMASQANYHSYASAAAYMAGPLDSLHTVDKLGSVNSFSNDAMCDYLMGGGLREAYQYD